MPGHRVGDVDLAPPRVEGALVRASVARRAARVGREHGPPPRHEVADPGLPVDGGLAGRTRRGRRRAAEGRAARAPRPAGRRRAGATASPWTVAPSWAVHVTGRGSGRSTASSSPGAPRAHTSRRPPDGSSTVSCGAVRPPDRTHAIPPRTPVETRVPPPRELADGSVARRHHDEPPEAVFVAVDRRPRCRRATTRTTAARDPTTARRARAPPRAAGGAATHRPARATRSSNPVRRTRTRARRRSARSAADRPRSRRHRRRRGARRHRAARRCATRPRACSGGPTRARPTWRRRATTRDPTRSRHARPVRATRHRRGGPPRRHTRRRARRRTQPDRRPGRRSAPRRARRARAPAPARPSPRSRGADHRPPRTPGCRRSAQQYPPPPYAPRVVTGNSAVTTLAAPERSAGATTRSTRPPKASSHASRVPSGDHLASPSARDRATAAAEIGLTPARLTSAGPAPRRPRSATGARPRRQPTAGHPSDCIGPDLDFRPNRTASARLCGSCRRSPTVSASPGWSTGATRTAAARASTPGTSPAS